MRATSILKGEKRSRTRKVQFETVTVYYFSRRQGFTSVPSQGGSTLGMSSHHCRVRQYTLGEFALEQERSHRNMLRDHLKEEKLNAIRLKLTKNGTVESKEASVLTVEDISDDDIDLDNTEVDEYFFLQPLTTKKRRALLRASGVKRIDVEEKHELRAIRVSREDCGCDCRVDRMSFPCGCSKEGCSNTAGRIEFNPIRVRTHFLHTIMKLELEKSREQQQACTVNGYHGEAGDTHGNDPAQSQHSVEYSLPDAVPQAAVVHLQAAEEMDEPAEDEDEEEEDEEEENDEDEDDGSSLCSGLTDSSTQSLTPTDSEEETDDHEGKVNEFEDGSATAPLTHAEVVPLSTVLCFPATTTAQENHSNRNMYFPNPSAEYYQCHELQSSGSMTSVATGSQSSESFGKASPFQDGVASGNATLSLESLGAAPESYTEYSEPTQGRYAGHHFPLTNGAPSVIVCCSPDREASVSLSAGYHDPVAGHAHTDFQNYLNGNAPECYSGKDSHCPADPANKRREGSLAEGKTGSPSIEHLSQVTLV
ncbi:cysteine/serine-rich nuclear protein 3-like [Scleropages formosus]|uniref:Cysteine/serine-rich nuclear protein 3-like n=1 Tax=Scleropages formosus TaxID=113540 RepID=A0A0N8JW30_SCLFO|nr:cysteine/serine-rich nuclear protein 3-like [Scleropages formosus]